MKPFNLDTKGLGTVWVIVLVLIIGVLSLLAGTMIGNAYLVSWDTGEGTTGLTITKKTTTPTTTATATKTTTTTATATPTTTVSTADWKTYENKEAKFSFKYPSSWTVKLSSKELGGTTYYTATITASSGEIFSLAKPTKEQGYEAWDFGNEKIITAADGTKFTRKIGEPKPNSGVNVKEYYWADTGAGKTSEEYFTKTAALIGQTDDLTPKLIGQLDLILSTFQFTQ